MSNEYAKALGAKLRTVRNQQGLSLQGVEAKSGGAWKAVVLADFYGVPLGELLPEQSSPAVVEPPPRLVIDLERLGQIRADKAGPLARYVAAIQAQRGDYNGRVLSIRQDDLRTLAVIYDEAPGPLSEQLIVWGVLNPEARRALD
jgi:hypothetical protein